jgi:hypothetical protein
MSGKKVKIEQPSAFDMLRDNILNLDIIHFIETYLTLDGAPFRLTGNGYKPFVEIYRYIALKAVEPTAKPVILVKGRQIGGTTMAAALECYFVACGLFGNNGRPPMRMGHLFPTLSLAASYSKTKLDPMISSSKPMPGVLKSNGMLKSFMESKLDTSSPANNNMHFKLFQGRNLLFVESSGIDGDRIRGLTMDCAFFDEVQDIPSIALGAVTKVLAQAHYGAVGEGVQVYFGTPKQKGTNYHNMWKMAEQHYYHLRCESCEGLFPLYRPDVNWEDIWLYGKIVKCTECGHEQEKIQAAENGQWVRFGGADPKDSKYIGYHINQLYIPHFTKETILGQKPEKNPNNTERIYQNEVLGEFYDGDGSLISPEEIYENCGDIGRQFTKSIGSHENKMVYAGFDWGQRGALDQLAGRQRGQSYSCGVILTAESPNRFVIEFATRLQKTDPQSKLDIVDEMFRRYSIQVAVGDIGDAYDLTHALQRKYFERFLASRAAPKVIGHVKFTRDIFPKEIVFERDYYYSELMGLLKSGAIRFPMGQFEEVSWLINHCCSMDVRANIGRQGDPIRRYIKGPSPNDGFASLLNAYLAYKFHITQGFKITQPALMKYEIAKRNAKIPAVLGYMPKRGQSS